MNSVKLALNICTYKRTQILEKNLSVLRGSEFFNPSNPHYYNNLDIFVVDNASELEFEQFPHFHLFHNPNTGGSGGFQRGIEEIRKINNFTHVVFMDDDVSFDISSLYILFDFLENVDEANADRPVTGRMLDKEKPNIQWTAGEKWNAGNIKHVEFLRDITSSANPYIPGKVLYDADADYCGFWLCCYPYHYVQANDILPFFLHCDDVEYGLRYGKTPIAIEGFHVWHDTWEKKMSPVILYYDIRNTFFVNHMYNLYNGSRELYDEWIDKVRLYSNNNDLLSEYIAIKAMDDFLKGINYLKRTNQERNYSIILNKHPSKIQNKLYFYLISRKFKQRIGAKNV